MILKDVSKIEMEDVLKNSKSMREVILNFKLSPNGSGGYINIKDRIKKLGLEIPKYNYYGDGSKKNKLLNKDIFCEKSTFSRQHLKERIIKEKLIVYECNNDDCNIKDIWCGKPISLHLDHKNGINDDNRLDNLRFLCPNCHSQTETYGGKSNKK